MTNVVAMPGVLAPDRPAGDQESQRTRLDMRERVCVSLPANIKDRRRLVIKFVTSKAGELMEKWGVDSVRITELHPETTAVIESKGSKIEVYDFEIVGGGDDERRGDAGRAGSGRGQRGAAGGVVGGERVYAENGRRAGASETILH